jgi:DNA-binding MarR family transcriptional regulator
MHYHVAMLSYPEKAELIKLRILKALSEPGALEYGITATWRVSHAADPRTDSSSDVKHVDREKVLEKLIKDGLVERRPDAHHKTAKPYFITLLGTEYLEAATRKAMFPEISQRQDWSTGEPGDGLQATITSFLRGLPEFHASGEDRIQQVGQELAQALPPTRRK